jgi:uncharacterized protein (TIGR03083 family)
VAGSGLVSTVSPGAASQDEPVVALLDEEWQAIAGLGDELAPDEWELPSECPGWSVRDLVSHMIGTERSLLGESAPPDPGPASHVHNPMGAVNEAWVAPRRANAGSEVVAEFREVTARRLGELRAFDEARWSTPGPSPVGNVPYREFMQVRLMDCWVHEQDMRVATGRPGHASGPVADVALSRIASAMGFVVAKKAAAPDGASVRFVLAGAPPRLLDVEVEQGRGRVGSLTPVPSPVSVADGGPERSVVLDMDTELFWRLGCGRVLGEAALDAALVGIQGDLELGRNVVRNMAFMI